MDSQLEAGSDRQAQALRASLSVLDAVEGALASLRRTWDGPRVADWARHVLDHGGRVVLCGMGKSGLVAQKISATLASTGCPSFFLHPAEAIHGDLGMVTAADTMLILSNSGETEEVVRLLPSLIRLGLPIASITARPDSTLGRTSKWCFAYDLPLGEGCPLGVAPMASTTLQILWGDLLAAQRMSLAGFTRSGFAEFHPGGSLGAKLMTTRQLMVENPPVVPPEAGFADVLGAMTAGRLGMTTVQTQGELVGVVSDGDIRRALERSRTRGQNPLDLKAVDFLTAHPVHISADSLALEAAHIMEDRKITFLVAMEAGRVAGVLHIHHLLQAKVL